MDTDLFVNDNPEFITTKYFKSIPDNEKKEIKDFCNGNIGYKYRIESDSISFSPFKNIETELKTILLMLYGKNKITEDEISGFWPYARIADKKGKLILGENGCEIFLRNGGALHPPIQVFGNGSWGFKMFLKFPDRTSKKDSGFEVVIEYNWKTKKYELYGGCGAEELAIATHWITEGNKGAESVQACMALTEMANLEPEKFKQKFKKYLEKVGDKQDKSGCIVPIIVSGALFASTVIFLIVYV